MDDLDHSVLIADQDWDCFYTESEECSIQQAKLAALDDSGLSDTEDDKTSTQVPSHSAQTTPSAEEQKQCLAVECEHTSEKSKLNQSAGHTRDTILNEQEITSECSVLDQIESNKERSCTEPSHLVINNLKGNSESVIVSLCNRDIKYENGTESTRTEVTDSLPLPRKEKERWFVTVNDSPVRLREKVGASGQKKRRKKKPSRNRSQQSAADRKRRSSVNNTELEKDIFERQSMPEKFNQPPKRDFTDLSTTYAYKENYLSDDIQDLQSSLSIESTPGDINLTEEGSPRFNLDASKTIAPSDSEGERTEQQEIFEQESSLKETPCLESSSNIAQTPDETLGPTRPIFAMSSFWDEMEKWTINDILELRIAKKKSQLTESFIPEEGKSMETIDAHDPGEADSKDDQIDESVLMDDAADSDYFTHLDDCKPDRSSCEFSTFSDYEEEFLLHRSTNPSPAPSESKEQCVLEPTRNLLQENSDQIWPSYQSESNEIVRLYPERDLPLFMYSEVEAQTQDMLLKTTQDNSMSSFLLDRCDLRRSTPSPVLSISDVLDDQCLMPFFEIMDNQDSEQFQTTANISVSFPFSQNLLSVPETYDDFFCDFEVGNFLFPSVKGTTQCKKKTVPIYSSSRSVVKDLTVPEMKETVQSDNEDQGMPILPIITHITNQQRCASPSGTPNQCFNTNHRNTWRNLSLRQIKFSFMGRTWCRMATSWVSRKTADTTFQEIWDIATTSNSSKAHPKVPVLLLENETLGYSKEEDICAPGRDRFRYSIKQADMCLVCIAFASWVLKSTNPQSTDMWKAALLANVSAISAIQYLRRYIKEENEP